MEVTQQMRDETAEKMVVRAGEEVERCNEKLERLHWHPVGSVARGVTIGLGYISSTLDALGTGIYALEAMQTRKRLKRIAHQCQPIEEHRDACGDVLDALCEKLGHTRSAELLVENDLSVPQEWQEQFFFIETEPDTTCETNGHLNEGTMPELTQPPFPEASHRETLDFLATLERSTVYNKMIQRVEYV